MSAPVQNEPAKPTPTWANEELRKYAPRRHQSDGGLPVQDSSPFSPLPSHLVARQNALTATPSVTDLVDEEFRRGLLSAKLDPVVMPLPPVDSDRTSRLGAIVRIGAAIGIAASVAMMVANVVTLDDGGSERSRKSPIMPAAVLESLAQIDPAEAKMAQEDPPATAAIIASASPDAGPRPWPPTSSAAAATAAPAPAALAASNPVPAASSVPPRPTMPLPREEVESLMKRGRDLLSAGDVASARLILTRLSDAGHADASFLLARTYDPIELTKLRLLGAVPDPARARTWYLKAAEQGSPEASRRVQQSAVR